MKYVSSKIIKHWNTSDEFNNIDPELKSSCEVKRIPSVRFDVLASTNMNMAVF
jgi:hypothetical protein